MHDQVFELSFIQNFSFTISERREHEHHYISFLKMYGSQWRHVVTVVSSFLSLASTTSLAFILPKGYILRAPWWIRRPNVENKSDLADSRGIEGDSLRRSYHLFHRQDWCLPRHPAATARKHSESLILYNKYSGQVGKLWKNPRDVWKRYWRCAFGLYFMDRCIPLTRAEDLLCDYVDT